MQETRYDICKETLTILAFLEEDLLDKLPTEIFETLKKFAADSKREFFIDPQKDLEDQNISEKTKDLIALLYCNYIADESEKKELIKILDENEKIYQEEIRRKNNFNAIFPQSREVDSVIKESNTPNNSIQEYKEPFFEKLRNFVFKILHIK